MNTLLFFGNIGMGEIILVALVVLLCFGGKKIPELMRGLGKGMRSFQDGMRDVERELQIEDAPAKPQRGTKSEGTSAGEATADDAAADEQSKSTDANA